MSLVYIDRPTPGTRVIASGPPTTSRMKNYYGTVATVLEASDDGRTLRLFDVDGREWTETRKHRWLAAGDDLAGPPSVPGNPVAIVQFSQVNGAASIRQLFMRWRGPNVGSYLPGGLDAQAGCELNGRLGYLATRTKQDVELLLPSTGWRVVTLDHAAEALEEAGFVLGTDRSRFHVLYADDPLGDAKWRQHDTWFWDAFVVRDPASPHATKGPRR